MKVFKVNQDHNYRSYGFGSSDWRETHLLFRGESHLSDWEPLSVTFIEGTLTYPKADFSPFLAGLALVNERTQSILSAHISHEVEFLPVTAPEGAKLYALNVTNLNNALDLARTEFKYFRDRQRIMRIVKHVFDPTLLSEVSLFRISQLPAQVYATNKFLDRVNRAQLSGLKFELVWSENEVEAVSEIANKILPHIAEVSTSKFSRSIKESELTESEYSNLLANSNIAWQYLTVDRENDVPEIIKGIQESVRRMTQKGVLDIELKLAAFRLGALWGEQVCKTYNWHWAELTFINGREYQQTAVVSPDGAFCILPMNFIWKHLAEPERQETIVLLFNMLSKPEVGGAQAISNAYQVLS